MEPNNAETWLAVATERALDAEAMLSSRPNSVGSVYMAGYVVECALKAYLKGRNKSFTIRGAEGHNLKGLWNAAGFRLSDLNDTSGERTYYIELWGTHLRYESEINSNIPACSLLKGAKFLVGWIQNQIRRQRRNK